jgi:uncharacterized UBP type Zn finger protein
MHRFGRRKLSEEAQQDADEYLRFMITGMEAEMRGLKNTWPDNLIYKMFYMETCERIECGNSDCNLSSFISFTPDTIIQVYVNEKGINSVDNALKTDVFGRKACPNQECRHCMKKAYSTTKQKVVLTSSNVLILHLIRYKYDAETKQSSMNPDKVIFSFDLQLNTKTVGDAMDNSVHYQLNGLVVHLNSGVSRSIHSGHYIAYVKVRGMTLDISFYI